MQFDLFHSIGRIDSLKPSLSDRDVFRSFFEQATLAESCGMGTIWVAESHFSSEVQKRHKDAVIPNYQGEVGINCDSCQLAQVLFAKTRRIGFGTAIFNIVGGNGGPIAAADRINSLAFMNSLSDAPRRLDIGFAGGRFPYINSPFGITPRTSEEAKHWSEIRPLIFLEALEIFMRLVGGKILSSHDLTQYHFADQRPLEARWQFDALRLVPVLDESQRQVLNLVLGSHDPRARQLALSLGDCDLFNLSFTAPDKIDAIHLEMTKACSDRPRPWHRSRLPRTVLVFIDQNTTQATRRASATIDTYIEAMRGTVELPPKEVLMSRALIGDATRIRELLAPGSPMGFHQDDRLMLWFEFNQSDHEAILQQMRQFADSVLPFC